MTKENPAEKSLPHILAIFGRDFFLISALLMAWGGLVVMFVWSTIGVCR